MAKKTLKVWGGIVWQGGNFRAIVADYTKAGALARLKAQYATMSIYQFNGWWSVTGNALEVSTAKTPGVWAYDGKGGLKTVEVKK